jgi:hypothetical protein
MDSRTGNSGVMVSNLISMKSYYDGGPCFASCTMNVACESVVLLKPTGQVKYDCYLLNLSLNSTNTIVNTDASAYSRRGKLIFYENQKINQF